MSTAIAALLGTLVAPPVNALASSSAARPGMAYVPSGTYVPLYATESSTSRRIQVPGFFLDIYPVTNSDYLVFLKTQPQWQRSQAPEILADAGYLRRWPAALSFGGIADAQRPVTDISWFAARAYCRWRGARLPSVAEWERAAAEQTDTGDARERLLRWYSRAATWPIAPVGSTSANIYGIWDLHGLIWEWTEDYNGAALTTASANRYSCGASVGANDVRDYPAFMRFALRSSLRGSYTLLNLGFRCAVDAREEPHDKL